MVIWSLCIHGRASLQILKLNEKDGKYVAESGINSWKSCLGMVLIL
jgi:hypothetical protein